MEANNPVPDSAFLDDSEMGRLTRAYDWSQTSVGPLSTWPQSLKTTVSILLCSPVPMVLLWGPDGVMIYNDAYSGLAGGRHPRLFGSKVREGWPEVADFNDNVMKVGLSGGTLSYRDQELTLSRNGAPEQVWMNLDYSPVLDESGQPAGVLAVVVETTARVLAERVLEATQERLSHALNASGMVGTFDWHIQADVFYSDPQFAAMFSVDPEKGVMGAPIADYMAGIHPDDQDRIAKAVNQAIATGEKYVQEYRLLRQDGSIHWIEARGECVYDEAGKPQRFAGAVVDITERKRAEDVVHQREQNFRSIFEHSNDAIFVIDPKSDMIVQANSKASKMLEYSPEELLRTPISAIHPDEMLKLRQFAGSVFEQGSGWTDELTCRTKSGATLLAEISASLIEIDGQPQILAMVRDVTARRGAERLQQTLVHELTHRVKNILATVQSIARQTFRSGPLDGNARETFEARLHALSRAHDLLTRENWDGAEMATVVGEVLGPYQRQRFEIAGPHLRLPPRVALALTLALHELATNAAKYGALSVPRAGWRSRGRLRPVIRPASPCAGRSMAARPYRRRRKGVSDRA